MESKMHIKEYYLVDPKTQKFVQIQQDLNPSVEYIQFRLIFELKNATRFINKERAESYISSLTENFTYKGQNNTTETQEGIRAEVYSITVELTKE